MQEPEKKHYYSAGKYYDLDTTLVTTLTGEHIPLRQALDVEQRQTAEKPTVSQQTEIPKAIVSINVINCKKVTPPNQRSATDKLIEAATAPYYKGLSPETESFMKVWQESSFPVTPENAIRAAQLAYRGRHETAAKEFAKIATMMLRCSHRGQMSSDSIELFCQDCGRNLITPTLKFGKTNEELFTQPDRETARSLIEAICHQHKQIP